MTQEKNTTNQKKLKVKFSKLNPLVKITFVSSILVLLFIVTTTFLTIFLKPGSYLGLFKGERTLNWVSKAALYSAERVADVEKTRAETKFDRKQNIMFVFETTPISEVKNIEYFVYNEKNEIIRNGEYSINPDLDEIKSRISYIYITTPSEKEMQTGKYHIVVKDKSDGQIVIKRNFSIYSIEQ